MIQNYTAARLIALHDQRWAHLGDWRNRWEELSFYIMPQMRSFTSHHNPGNRRQEQLIYDSTALEANERLATRMGEALTNPSTNWFRLEFKDPEINKADLAREWLDECRARMAQALEDSNFYMTVGQFHLDVGCLGTAVLACDEKLPQYSNEDSGQFHGLVFKAVHMEGCSFGENVDGQIDQVFHKFEMTAEQLYQKFGDRAGRRVLDMLEEGKPDFKVKVLLCRFPRYTENRPTGPLLPQERPYAEVWINYSDKEIIHDGGTYEQAVFTGRWRRKSIDIMGYGPGERALATIRTVNEAERLELAAWAKIIDPPIKTSQNNVIGDIDIQAKGVTVVRRMDELEEWDLKPDLNHHMIQLEDKRYQIRDIFKYHSLELPAREAVGEMTAYEIAKRIEQIYRALGPTVVQLRADVLDPLIQRVFGIMYRKGALPSIPEEFEGQEFTTTYVGPMALAARSTEIDAMDKYIADNMALASSGFPQAMDIIDLDGAQRYKATLMGVPAVAIRAEEDVTEIRAQREQTEAEARQAENYATRMGGLKDASQAIGQENVMGAMEAMAGEGLE